MMVFDYKKRTFSLGKWDYSGRGRRINEAEIDIRLDKDDDRFRVSIGGGLWNGRKTDYVYCGQCIDNLGDDFPALKKSNLYNTLFDIWQNCHLKYLDTLDEKYVEKINLLLDGTKSDLEIKRILAVK